MLRRVEARIEAEPPRRPVRPGGTACECQSASTPAPIVVASGGASGGASTVALFAACVYLVALFLSGVAPKVVDALVPPTARYFVQATCLFPRAARMAIDYRLEGWDCQAAEFRELDPTSYFPIHSDDKESRFYRTAFFFRRQRQVMEALERFVLEQENTRAQAPALGGLRLSSLRHPLPEVGASVERWTRRPLHEHPAELNKAWFYTPQSRRQFNCDAVAKPGAALELAR